MAILGILTGIAILSIHVVIEKSKRDVCTINSTEFERMYESELAGV